MNRSVLFNKSKRISTILITIILTTLILSFSIVTTSAGTIDISECNISGIKVMEHTGERVRLNISVIDGGTKLVIGTDYKLIYRDNINPGTATVIIQGLGPYRGEVIRTFEISPKKVTGLRVFLLSIRENGELKLSWDKDEEVDGYQIYCIVDGGKGILRTIKGNSNNSIFSITNLKTYGKYVYSSCRFKVRSFRIVDDKTIVGPYSDSVTMNIPTYTYYNDIHLLYTKDFDPEIDIEGEGEEPFTPYVKNRLIIYVDNDLLYNFDKAKKLFDSYGADIIEYRIFLESYIIEFREYKNYDQLFKLQEEIQNETGIIGTSIYVYWSINGD